MLSLHAAEEQTLDSTPPSLNWTNTEDFSFLEKMRPKGGPGTRLQPRETQSP
ncbi:Fc Receptor-Like Protein 1 [Manis pentadactyla]|nr:Fc Receptor-Like Protein 1 [Manis pentadactyla]